MWNNDGFTSLVERFKRAPRDGVLSIEGEATK